MFENCTFSDFKTPAVKLGEVKVAEFIDCTFRNCYDFCHHSADYPEWGGVIRALNGINNHIQLTNCKFQNCGIKNLGSLAGLVGVGSSSIISNAVSAVFNCIFDNCKGYNGTVEQSYGGGRSRLFGKLSANEDNKVTNSAQLG
jgi:hypothetical protein